MQNNNIRPETMERITTKALADAFIEEQVKEVRAQVGDKKVLLALSGGAISAFIIAMAIYMIVRGTKKIKLLEAEKECSDE